MNAEELERIIKRGEGVSIEFKESRTSLPGNTFDSICGFLNRQGGHLILGVDDNGQIVGVDEAAADTIQRDFATLSNNPTKLQPVCLLELNTIRIRGFLILYVYVPQSSQVHSTGGKVIDRKHEGDFKVVGDTAISQLYARKSGYYSESKIYPYLGASAFKPGLIDKARNLIKSNNPNHPWLSLDDKEFLRKAGLYKVDYITGEQGYTLAAALLLGRDEVLQDIVPHFRIDALVRRQNLDRYDDRLDIRTNLIEAYESLMAFVAKHLPDAFYLEADQRVSLREKIFREVVANVLVHRDYTNGIPARFIIYNDRVEIDNANKPASYGVINPEQFSPFPKNPNIAKFFVQLGRVDELGSGIRNVTHYLKKYTPGGSAAFIEEDVFRTIVPTPPLVRAEVIAPTFPIVQLTDSQPDLDYIIDKISKLDLNFSTSDRLVKEMTFFSFGEVLTAVEVADLLGVTVRTVRRDFQVLRENALIESGVEHATYKMANRKI